MKKIKVLRKSLLVSLSLLLVINLSFVSFAAEDTQNKNSQNEDGVTNTPDPSVTPDTRPEVEIEDDQTPEIVIEDEDTPESGAAWALLNLILTNVVVIASIYMLFRHFKDKEDDEENKEKGNERKLEKKGRYRIISIVVAIISIITFILTEDMTLPMIIVDRWTPLMVVYALVQSLVAYKSKQEYKDREEVETQQ